MPTLATGKFVAPLPLATLKRTQIEVPKLVWGKLSYRWVPGMIVITPDGNEIQPYMYINDAKRYCREQGWRYLIVD